MCAMAGRREVGARKRFGEGKGAEGEERETERVGRREALERGGVRDGGRGGRRCREVEEAGVE